MIIIKVTLMNFIRLEKYVLLVVILYFFGFYTMLAQNITFTLEKTDTLNRSVKDLFNTDINGDTCSLAIFKTNLKNIKFYTNRSVERIENTGEEYRVWISNGSTLLKIAIPNLPLLEYKLQNTAKRPVLYVFILNIIPDSLKSIIIFNDTINPVFSINSNPRDANLFVNNFIVGKTPAKVPITETGVTFDYKIVKPGYVTVKGIDSTRSKDYNLTIDMVPRSKVKMNFIEFSIGKTWFNSEWFDKNWNSGRNWSHNIYGITVGKTGGTGWYSGTKIGYIIRALEGPLTSPKFNDLRISFGLTQSLTKVFQAYGKLGAGYAFSKDTYESSMGTIKYNFNGICLDIGLIFKIGSRILLSAEFNPIIGKYSPEESKIAVVDGDYSFGLGYAFNKKK